MKCPGCGSYNIGDYDDGIHVQCKDCRWIFLIEKPKKTIKKTAVKKVFFDEELIWR